MCFDTVSQAMKFWNEKGYTESFQAKKEGVFASFSKQIIRPEDIEVIQTYRFDGMTNPADDAELLIAKSKNGIKGTLLISHSSEHNNHPETIRKIK